MGRTQNQPWSIAAALIMALPSIPACAQAPPSAPSTPSTSPEVLDRVIAVVNRDVLLESDVQEEMRFAILQPYVIPPGRNTRERAARRLINRNLILQQMKEQQAAAAPTNQEVQQRLDENRKSLPACGPYHCQTEEGWNKFLADNDFTEEEVRERLREQLLILKFIEVRFRAGIRVSQAEIQDFYQKTMVPQFAKNKIPPPPLTSVSARVEEVVLQQKVNILLQEWLRSLRAQGSVRILDPAYAHVANAEAENGGDE